MLEAIVILLFHYNLFRKILISKRHNIRVALRELKQKAIDLRNSGHSYTQIKQKIGVSKSTLSGWLYDMPLSEERIRQLQADNPIRIEHYRNTMRAKREKRFREAYEIISKEIGSISDRELLIAGFFLYWGEGNKTRNSSVGLTNSNPDMLKVYIKLLGLFGIRIDQLKVSLKLYSDMDIQKQEKYWSQELRIPLSQFRKSYIKKTLHSSITYKNGIWPRHLFNSI